MKWWLIGFWNHVRGMSALEFWAVFGAAAICGSLIRYHYVLSIW